MCGPLGGVGFELLVRGGRAVGLQDSGNLAALVHVVEVGEAAVGDSTRFGKLKSITKEPETASLSVCGQRRLEGTGERQLAVRGASCEWHSCCRGRQAGLTHYVGLPHGRREIGVLAKTAVLVFAAVHAALTLLPLRERLRT